MSFIAKATVGGAEYPIGSSLYGTCATAAGTKAKVVTMPAFDTLVPGVTIHVKFTYSNTVASPTLNVNGTGAKNIYRYGTTTPSTTAATSWNAGSVVSFTYDGSNWQMNDWLNTSGDAATSTPANVASSGSVGTSTSYAREDHVHGIAVESGDSNGQVKIAGTNVGVTGLGSAAYTDSSDYAAASHGTHVTYGTSAQNVGTTSSAGSASTVSRSDHVHGIALATGDANGQVKIAGTNVPVKGLGSAAYTDSSDYAAASHGTHVTYGTSASAVGTTSSAGTASTVSRSDHVHNIALATGDSNGQVKIAGTNVSVKGLGSAAYTESSDYAAASHGTHVTYGTTASAVSTTSSAGSAATVSRSDHVHGVSLATGDSNGQVKIAGTNVSVKGLRGAAFKEVLTGTDDPEDVESQLQEGDVYIQIGGSVAPDVYPATEAPKPVSTAGVVGVSAKYAREDHVHSITVGTGDSNGQVKIAGINASVKGLGSAAYTDSTDYAPVSHGTHVTYGTSASAVGTTASAGSAATVSRSDHVHSISLASGDNNGQVKIAGANVNVTGLRGAAFKEVLTGTAEPEDVESQLQDGDVYIQIGGEIAPDVYPATSTPADVSTTGAVGVSAKYAREDHVHKIALATGDANGQVKIAGTNVSVKGLGSAAYTDSSAYAAANHGVHVTYGTSASAVSTTASAGTATTVSRSDHTHSLALASGDSNGQVKIAGTNVSVKGLGSAAYTDSSAYAAASHGTHVTYGTSATAVGTTSAAGTAATVSRSDHKHSIALGSGDANGQVKIAGQNVNVTGLRGAAFKEVLTGTDDPEDVESQLQEGDVYIQIGGEIAPSVYPATNTPANVSTTGVVGVSAKYAREDHVHAITLASGDSNGQVKIAGQNVSVKGLGTAAYTASTAYASASHTHELDTTSVGSASGWSAGTVPTLGTAISADDITSWSAGTLPSLGAAISADDITSWDAGAVPTLGTAITADDITSWSAGAVPTLGTAITADDITAWDAGAVPTLGTAIAADDITSWDAGAVPTLGTAIAADDITSWSAGTVPTLGTAIAADDITSWSAGSATTASVSAGILTLSIGTVPALSYTARSIPNVTSVGTLPSLSYTARSIPNVTSVGSLPSLSYTARSIPNVTSVGSLPSLSYTARTIPNVTSVGSLPSLSYTARTIPNVTSVGSLPSLSFTSRSIPNVTSVGTLPSLSYSAKSIPNVTSVGTAPSLTITNKTVVTGISTE